MNGILITGGSGGLGGELAKSIARHGYVPIICFKNNEASARTIAAQSNGIAIKLDLSDHADIERCISELENVPSEPCAVVAAASPSLSLQAFGQATSDDMRAQFEVQVIGHHRLMSAVIRKWLKRRKTGVLGAVLSAGMGDGHKAALKNAPAYIVAKYGLQGLLAAAKADHPWLHTLVTSPGFLDTAMLEGLGSTLVEHLKAQGLVQPPQQVAEEFAVSIATALQRTEPHT